MVGWVGRRRRVEMWRPAALEPDLRAAGRCGACKPTVPTSWAEGLSSIASSGRSRNRRRTPGRGGDDLDRCCRLSGLAD
jgi:hypothetical protein